MLFYTIRPTTDASVFEVLHKGLMMGSRVMVAP